MDVPLPAVDRFGNMIDFYLSPARNAKAAKLFLGKALNGLKDWEKPTVINTDKAPTYGFAIAQLKAEGKCPGDLVHRQVKYLNNVIEADHGKLKQLIRPVRGFKTLKTAYSTIKGFEIMRALSKGQAAIFKLTGDARGEAGIVERAFDIGPSALTEAVALLAQNLENREAARESTCQPTAVITGVEIYNRAVTLMELPRSSIIQRKLQPGPSLLHRNTVHVSRPG